MQHLLQWLRRAARRPRQQQSRAVHVRRASFQLELLECRAMLAASVTPVYTVTNRWDSGFQADLRLDSQQPASVAPWRLDFDLAANITSIWNARITSHVGNHYTVTGENWNRTLPAAGSVEFGFVATGAATNQPGNYRLNGEPLGGAVPVSPGLSIGDVSLAEGASGTAVAQFTVALSAPAAAPVTVRYATADGTALAGSDYRAASGLLTFAAGETSKTVSVAVQGDALVEPDETFFVDLSSPAGATLVRARATGTIRNDDAPPAPAGDFQFQVSSDWGSGFTGQLTMRNGGPAAISNWQLEFDFAGDITSIWDARIKSRVDQHYVVEHAGYNATISAGGALGFGFNGSPGHLTTGPTNYVLRGDGAPGGEPPTAVNRAPSAASDVAYRSPGQSVVIAPLANDSDPDGDALAIAAVTQGAQGAVVRESDATVRYTPRPGFTGSDAFTYQVRDARGATATGTVTVHVAAAGAWPAQVFAPYVDMGLYPTYDLLAAARSQGLRYFSLAFVVADPQGQPSWGGYSEYGLGSAYDAQLRTQLAGLRALGGDVVVSFGGASGRELAEVIHDVPSLVRAYQAVIDAYGLTHVDFDIEGAAVADAASIDRRNAAIAVLQSHAAAGGRTLDVSYTLPVLPIGLTPAGLYVVQSAARWGVRVDLVNIMAMDYGDSAAPNPQGRMGDYAIAAANSLFTQLSGVYGTTRTAAQLWHMIGVTPMIGLNDVVTETFDQQEARELLEFAQRQGLGRIAFWSLNRDQQHPAGTLAWVDLKSSSIRQQPFEFSRIFMPFTA